MFCNFLLVIFLHRSELKTSYKAQGGIHPKQLRLDIMDIESHYYTLFFHYLIEYWFSIRLVLAHDTLSNDSR